MNSKAGLLFEEIGSIRVWSNEWKILLHINLTSYDEEFEHIKTMVDKALNLCQEVKQVQFTIHGRNISKEEECGAVAEQLKVIVKELDEYNVKWFISNNRENRKKKRVSKHNRSR